MMFYIWQVWSGGVEDGVYQLGGRENGLMGDHLGGETTYLSQQGVIGEWTLVLRNESISTESNKHVDYWAQLERSIFTLTVSVAPELHRDQLGSGTGNLVCPELWYGNRTLLQEKNWNWSEEPVVAENQLNNTFMLTFLSSW